MTNKPNPNRKWSAAKDRSHRARVRELVRPYRGTVGAVAFASFLGGATEALFLVIVTRTALAISGGKDTTGLVGGHTLSARGAIAVAVGLLVLRLALSMYSVAKSTHLSMAVLTALRRRLSGAYLRASWATQQGEASGQLQTLAGFAAAAGGVIASFTQTIVSLVNLAALLAIAVLIDPVATGVVIAALTVLSSVLAPIRQRIRGRSRVTAKATSEYFASLAEFGALGLEMQTFGVRDRFAENIDGLSEREARARQGSAYLQGALSPVYTTLAYGALLVGLSIAALVGVNELSAIGAVMLVMMRSLNYGQALQNASSNLMSSLPSLEHLDETMARYEADSATGGEVQLGGIGVVEAEHVSFAYQPDRRVLRDISFRIEPGEIVGVIGPSGAGKSSLVQLLLGLRDSSAGTVRVGGVDLRKVDRQSWSGRVAFVAQDANLFTGTVAENVRFFRDDLSDEALVEAARQANLLDDIRTMPEGFATFLGERGSRLSGGQRQRMSIARALAAKPELLILDEPTSALDSHSESLIRDTVTSLRGKVTVVIIAHRMSTLDMCDRIMVIESGELTAFDDPGALRARSDFYRHALAVSGMA